MGEYRIGEFAEKLCVTQDLLKHYEKYGILSPQRKGEGGYRYYDFNQSPQILFSKQLQNWGFSLKEISLVMKGMSSGHSIELLEKKLGLLKQTNQIVNWQIRYLEELCTILGHIKAGRFHGEWSIQESGKYLFFPHSEGSVFFKNDKHYRDLQKWIHMQGITSQGAVLSGIQSGPSRIVHGIIVPLEAAEDLDLKNSLPLSQYGGGKSFIYNCTLPVSEGIDSEQFMQEILREPRILFQKHNLKLSDHAFIRTHFLTKEGARILKHRQIIFEME